MTRGRRLVGFHQQHRPRQMIDEVACGTPDRKIAASPAALSLGREHDEVWGFLFQSVQQRRAGLALEAKTANRQPLIEQAAPCRLEKGASRQLVAMLNRQAQLKVAHRRRTELGKACIGHNVDQEQFAAKAPRQQNGLDQRGLGKI